MLLPNLFSGEGILIDTTALAAVALLGYMFGRRSRRAAFPPADVTLLIELARAQAIAKSLEHLTQRLRVEAQGHLASLAAFQGQIELMQKGAIPAEWRRLRQHADGLLTPTISLVGSLSSACDELRERQSQLMTFAEARIDRETGVLNRRAFHEHLQAQLSARGDGEVSLVLCSVDVDPYQDDSEEGLRGVSRLLEQYARGNDVVARYGPQELALLLPRTTLEGGEIVCERILKVVNASFERRVWCGVVQAEAEETSEELLARAESALRAAAQHEASAIFLHDGVAARRCAFEIAHGATAQPSCELVGENENSSMRSNGQ